MTRQPGARGGVEPGVLAIMLLAVTVYAVTLTFGFVFDDIWTIKDNPFIWRLSNLSRLFSADTLAQVPDANRPVMVLSTMLDYALFHLHPGGYHLQSVLWHAGCSGLVYLLVGRLFNRPMALVSGALFAVHPIHVEPVAAINYREDLLATFFVLSGLLAILRFRQGRRLRYLVAACLCAALAPLSKETGLLLPWLLVLCDATTPQPGGAWPRRGQAVLLAAIGLAVYLPLALALGDNHASIGAATAPLIDRLLTSTRVFIFSLGQFVVPLGLSPEYTTPVTGAGDLINLLCAAAVAAMLAMAVRWRRNRPVVFLGTLWFLLAMVPTANLVPIYNVRADRYLYLPSVGLCMLAASAICAVKTKRVLCATAVVVVCASWSLHTLAVWRTPIDLWTRGASEAPDSQRASEALTLACALGGQPDRAVQTATTAMQRFKHSWKLPMGLGIGLAAVGNYQQAIVYLHVALAGAPESNQAEIHNNLGVVYYRNGDYRRAETSYRSAVDSQPGSPLFRRHLGEALRANGRLQEAAEQFRRASEIAPHDQRSRLLLQ